MVPSALRRSIGPLAGAVAVGLGMALQSRLNAGLATETGSAAWAAAWSFGSGAVVLLVLALVVPGLRRGVRTIAGAVRAGRLPWWTLLGGLVGALYVISHGLSAAVVGVALFVVAVVAGQALSGLLLDSRGIAGTPAQPITWSRVAGTVLAIIAVVIAGWGQFSADVPWVALVLPFAAGLGIGFQSAVNGALSRTASNGFAAATVNFAVGAVALGIAAVVWLPFGGAPQAMPQTGWYLLGGVIGIAFITGSALLVGRIGVLRLGLGVVVGQLVGALALDLFWPTPGHTVGWAEPVGVAVAIAAAAVAVLRKPRTAEEPGPITQQKA